MKDRIALYLSHGLKAEAVASIVGCSPAYISQLLKNPDFKQDVEARMTEAAGGETDTLATKYESTEHTLVSAIGQAAAGADLPQLARALDSISRARDLREKRKNPALAAAAAGQVNVQVVSVMLPGHALPAPQQLQLNKQSEVIAIGDRALAPMSSANVKQLFNKLADAKESVHELPSITKGVEKLQELPSYQAAG